VTTTRIRITAPGFAFGRTGTATPAFSRGRYHVQLDGDRERPVDYGESDAERDAVLADLGWAPVRRRVAYAFDASEFEVLQ
jgi:hypothetical protein